MSQAQAIDTETVDELLAMVKRDPHRPGPAFARLVELERPVWAIIMHLQSFRGLEDAARASEADIADAANAYVVPRQAVRAAIAYYVKHRRSVDAFLLLNSESFDED